MKYVYEEGDCFCNKCGVLGDGSGGGDGSDGIERVVLCDASNSDIKSIFGSDNVIYHNDGVYCDDCIGMWKIGETNDRR